jgi:hypothetical protein
MSIVRNIGIVAAVAGCVLIALSPSRRQVVARQLSKARGWVSRRAVDQEARASVRDELRWADDGGVLHGATDRELASTR